MARMLNQLKETDILDLVELDRRDFVQRNIWYLMSFSTPKEALKPQLRQDNFPKNNQAG